MTAIELVHLVLETRRAQKSAGRSRSEAEWARAKRLERQLDDAVREILTQPVLPFGD